jgi:hypothetical protein|tara:strand:+ start:14710 stop:15222 length:513 start_codon:yes stop_codon:yes gene_type:complete
MSDKHNDQKLIMESFRNWSEDTPEALQEEQLDEIQIPGIAWFLRSYQWMEPLLRIVADSKRTPESLRGPVKSMADTLTTFKNAMDDFYENYPKLYATVMGPIMAADIAGTATGKAKEKILQTIYKNIDKIEPAEEDTPEPQQPEQEEPTSPAITKREKNPRPVVINKVRE